MGAGAELQLALVTANKDPKGRGRVKVRYAWMDDGEQTGWLRVAGLGGGDGHGLGVLPEVGNEVVVAAVAGDAEHPVVLGTLWNGTDKAGHAPGRQGWKTKAGSGIHLSEGRQPGQQRLEMHTPGGTVMVRLNAATQTLTLYAAKDIAIEAPNGEIRLHAKTLTAHVDQAAHAEVTGTLDAKVTKAVTVLCDDKLSIQGKEVALVSTTTLHTHATGEHYAFAQTMTAEAGGAHTVLGATVALNPEG